MSVFSQDGVGHVRTIDEDPVCQVPELGLSVRTSLKCFKQGNRITFPSSSVKCRFKGNKISTVSTG